MNTIVTSDWGGLPNQAPKRTYWETFTRHKRLACLPIVVALVAGAAFLATLKPSYTATSTMWVDNPIPSATSILGNGNPAGSASTVLRQMLMSSSFQTEAITASIPEAERSAWTREQVGAAGLSLAGRVLISSPGPQLIAITVKAPAPATARAEARAVAEQYTRFFAAALTRRNQQQVEFLRVVVANSSTAVDEAVNHLRDYQGRHPGSITNPADAAAAQLSGNVAQAQEQYRLVRQQLAEAEALAGDAVADAIASSGATGVPKLLDDPAGVARTGKKKAYVLGLAGSLFGGFTLSALVLALLMAADRSIRKESDIDELLGLAVLGTVEDVPRRQWSRPVPAAAPAHERV